MSPTDNKEFYLELSGGGDPSISSPEYLLVTESGAIEMAFPKNAGGVGSLAVNDWDYGNNDTLGFNTVYLRITADANPDTVDNIRVVQGGTDPRWLGGQRATAWGSRQPLNP